MRSGPIFIVLITIMLFSIASCERPPELSTVPIIKFESLSYFPKEGKGDSLVLTIQFEDNEGDLGVTVTGKDEEPVKIYPTDAQGNYIKLGSSDTLPEYNVCNYHPNPKINGVQLQDTIYFYEDPYFNNMFVTFYRKVRGTFEKFDFNTQSGPISGCQTMNGRFLRLNTQPQERPLQGSLSYGMQSFLFGRTIRKTDTLQLEVRIRDNALNFSEPLLTPEFTLEQLIVD